MTIILKENSKAIRDRIEAAGITVCICALFVDSCWLDYHPGITDAVHGVGSWGGETFAQSQEEALEHFMAECDEPVICKDVDEFIETIKKNK